MGPVAASGGYYISAGADQIVANPTTITGSIGIFTFAFDLSELYAKIGVSRETVKRGKLADVHSTFRGWTPEEAELMEKLISDLYSDFLDRVAEGREMDKKDVDAIGQGRVWTGRQAREKGLVDELGGLQYAIELARERIGLTPEEDFHVVHVPRARFSFRALLQEMGVLSDDGLALPESVHGTILRLAVLGTLSSEPALAMLPVMLTIR
jgi:protease-4